MRKALLASLLVGAAALVAYAVFSREKRPRVDRISSAETPGVPGSAALNPLPEDAVEASPELARADDAPLLARDVGKDARPQPATLRLQGSLVVSDSNGREHPRESGRFNLLLWSELGARVHAVTVDEGSWSLDAVPSQGSRPIEHLSVQHFELGQRVTIGTHPPGERLPIPANGRLDLRASWPPRLKLHVRPPDGDAELEGVNLYAPGEGESMDLAHPGSFVRAAHFRSPTLYLDAPARGSRFVYVGSPGYVWQRAEVLSEESERVVVLERGGDLEVRVEGTQRDQGTWLRLFEAGTGHRTPIAESGLHVMEQLRFEGLPIGPIEVVAQLGDRWDPRSLGSAETEIRAGEVSVVTLALSPVERATWVEVAGSLTLPIAWELEDFELVLGLQGPSLEGWSGQLVLPRAQMKLMNPAAGLHRWSARVQPGSYAILVPNAGYFTQLDVGPAGERDVHLSVPSPCVLRVRCVDEETGTDAAVDGLDWGYMQDAGLIPSSEPFQHDAATGIWELRAPEGRLLVRAFRAGETVQTTVAVTGDTNEVVLYFPRSTGLRVILLDGTSSVPWERGRLPGLHPLEGQPEPRSSGLSGNRILLRAKAPGSYSLSIPEIPGYELVADPARVAGRGSGHGARRRAAPQALRPSGVARSPGDAGCSASPSVQRLPGPCPCGA